MPARDARLRLFVAAYPPPDAAAAMRASLPGLDLAPHRPTPPEQVHLTLLFLGDTDARQLPEIRESVARSCAGLPPFHLAPRRLITLPPPRPRGGGPPPRLVALETDAPATLLEIVRRLVKRLARDPRKHPADRFLPHLTLCRFTHTGRPGHLDHPVTLPPFPIHEIALVHSKLTPAGAVHTPVETYPLSGD